MTGAREEGRKKVGPRFRGDDGGDKPRIAPDDIGSPPHAGAGTTDNKEMKKKPGFTGV